MLNNTSRLRAIGLIVALTVAIHGAVLRPSASAQEVQFTGVIDAKRTSEGAAVLTAPDGYSLLFPMTLLDNFPNLYACAASPLMCIPGRTVTLQWVPGDVSFYGTINGRSYSGGNLVGLLSLSGVSFSGSFTLPPLAPTASITSPVTLTGTIGAGGLGALPFRAQGTATLYVHSPSSPGFPDSWTIDRLVIRFQSSLPEPWQSVDVGVIGAGGSASASLSADGGTFTVSGAGADVWDTEDAFQFVVGHPAGDSIVARIDAVEDTDPWAKAGVMIRHSFRAFSKHVFLAAKPDGDVELLYRQAAGGPTTFLGGAAADFPVWLRLTDREVVTAAISSDGQNWQTIGTVGDLHANPSGPDFRLTGLAVTSRHVARVNTSRFSHVSLATSPTAPLPSGMMQSDVGNVQVPGSATVSGSQLVVSASGADIWGTTDAFHHVFTPVVTDGQIVARVTSMDDTSPWAKAGVMIRAGATSPPAAHAFLAVKPDGGIEFLSRADTSEPAVLVGTAYTSFPAWLRLTRIADTVSAAVSQDGATWSTVGAVDVPGLARAFQSTFGLAVTSQNNTVLNSAVFDSIGINAERGVPYPWHADDIGNVGAIGSSLHDEGTFTVRGAGADIWGIADAFHFVAQQKQTTSVSLSARLVSESGDDPWAKAGLMIRDCCAANAPFVMIAMLPGGEIEILQRITAGEPAIYHGGVMAGIGSHLRLERTGDNVALSYSSDGSSWTPLIAVPAMLSAQALIGMAVTSRDVNELNTALFDQVVLQ